MIESLEQLYYDGFCEDGIEYARFFCNGNYKYAVCYPKDNPLSCGYLIERELNNATKIGYLSALSTKKENRGLGFASIVVYEILNKANAKKYPFVVLGPFSPTYYKKFGFFDFDVRSKRKVIGGSVVAKTAKEEDVIAINSLFDSNTFSCAFNTEYFNKLQREAVVTKAKLYSLYKNDKIVGFCVKGRNYISNLICKNNEIENCNDFLGLEFLAKSTDGLPFLQMRITKIEEFLNLFKPLKKFDCRIKIKDCVIEENNRTLKLFSNGNKIETQIVENYDIELDIKDLYEFLVTQKCIEKINSDFIDNY